jgi:hypothetical protein
VIDEVDTALRLSDVPHSFTVYSLGDKPHS